MCVCIKKTSYMCIELYVWSSKFLPFKWGCYQVRKDSLDNHQDVLFRLYVVPRNWGPKKLIVILILVETNSNVNWIPPLTRITIVAIINTKSRKWTWRKNNNNRSSFLLVLILCCSIEVTSHTWNRTNFKRWNWNWIINNKTV